MLTQCPHCAAVFRVRAEHLRAARGFAACGACEQVFNVLARLVDEAQPAVPHAPEPVHEAFAPAATIEEPVVAPASLSDARPAAATALDEPDAGTPAAITMPDVFDEPPPAAGPQLGSEAALEAVALDMPSLFHEVQVEAAIAAPEVAFRAAEETAIPRAPEADDVSASPVPDAAPHPAQGEEVPAILRDELAALAGQERRRGRWAWALVALVLLGALAAQAGYIWRTPLFDRWPALEPWAQALCARLGCDLRVPLATGTVELLARDVRDHPQYAGTLLVNATLHNNGSRPAAYPVIQLGIYDHAGGIVGIRRFAPKEYLDQSIDPAAGLPPDSSVYVVLEIAGAGEAADSFEFTFL